MAMASDAMGGQAFEWISWATSGAYWAEAQILEWIRCAVSGGCWTRVQILEWVGCVLGVVGAGVLALNLRISGWGFVAFLFSNAVWIWFGLETGSNGLVTMQCFMTVTSMVGIWRWRHGLTLKGVVS